MSTPRLYVGTYAKYNSGSIAGKWLDLDDYADKEDFLKACAELHKDEADPEFMFQDYEGFPKSFYSESYVSDELFEFIELDDHDQKLLEIYRENISDDGTLQDAQEAYAGHGFSNKADWAAQWLEDTGGLQGVPEHLQNYIDYDAYARDSDMIFARDDNNVLWVFYNQ